MHTIQYYTVDLACSKKLCPPHATNRKTTETNELKIKQEACPVRSRDGRRSINVGRICWRGLSLEWRSDGSWEWWWWRRWAEEVSLSRDMTGEADGMTDARGVWKLPRFVRLYFTYFKNAACFAINLLPCRLNHFCSRLLALLLRKCGIQSKHISEKTSS